MKSNDYRSGVSSAKWLALAFVLSLSTQLVPVQKAQASHAVAADINYSWLGGLDYLFRVSYYSDCAGVSAPSALILNFSAPSCSQNFVITFPQTGPTGGVEILPVCSLGASTCNGGLVYGIKQYTYSGMVTLPAACADWKFYYEICCRNGAILNIVNPASQRQHFYATLNNLDTPGNSSPKFNTPTAPFNCIDLPFCFDLSAADADGDSLVYSLTTPLGINGIPLSWQAGFSATQPIPSSPAMTFDPQTGQACIWPAAQGQYVTAVKVDEYRNGVVVGSVLRDMQVNMAACPCLCVPPASIWATLVTSTTARLKWKKVGTALRYEVRYRVKGTSAWTVKKTAGNYNTKNITGLLPNTIYQWKVRSLCYDNPKIWSAWTTKKFFTTGPSPGREAAESFIAESISQPGAGSLTLYPSPANDRLLVSIEELSGCRAGICVYDLQGRIAICTQCDEPQVLLDVSRLEPGVYFIEMRCANIKARNKFVKR